jgi:DNA polymerase-3 subunit beta
VKFSCQKSDLVLPFSRIQGALLEKNYLYVFMETKNDVLHISANDSMIAIHAEAQCQIEQSGKVALPAKILTELMRELPFSGVVAFQADEQWMRITAGILNNFSMKIPLIREIQPRLVPTAVAGLQLILPSEKLAYMVDQVQFCISADAKRPFGTVAFIHQVAPTKLRFVATDSYRLSFCDLDLDEPSVMFKNGICVSKRCLTELGKMAGEKSATLTLGLFSGAKVLTGTLAGYQIYMGLSAVIYPDYHSVISSKNQFSFKIEKADLHGAIKRLMIASSIRKYLKFQFREKKLLISAKNQEGSEGVEEIGLPTLGAVQVEMVLNGRFFSEICSVSGSTEFEIRFSDQDSPISIIPQNEKPGLSSHHVLVPVNEFEETE